MADTGTTAPARVDPRKVMQRRRTLQFHNLDEIRQEAARLCDLVDGANSVREDLAVADEKVVHLANMPLGQALGHLGLVLSLSVDGSDFRFPFMMRLVANAFRAGIFSGRIAAPLEAPAELNRLVLPDAAMNADTGLAMLNEQFKRFEEAVELKPNAMFGRISREDWITLTCRHSEWHLGFMLIR